MDFSALLQRTVEPRWPGYDVSQAFQVAAVYTCCNAAKSGFFCGNGEPLTLGCAAANEIAGHAKSCYEPVMNEKHRKIDSLSLEKAIVLQDHKRLPGRFFSRLSGARTCRIG